MTVRVTQPDTGYASHSVRIMLDGVYIGSIGPGESITGQSATGGEEPWHLIATCGTFRAEAYGLQDAAFQIAWTLPAKMELRNVKHERLS